MKDQQNPRFSVEPMQGQKMPEKWRDNAPLRAKMADAAYKYNLENAWKGQDSQNSGSIMRDSRLKPLQWRDIIGEK